MNTGAVASFADSLSGQDDDEQLRRYIEQVRALIGDTPELAALEEELRRRSSGRPHYLPDAGPLGLNGLPLRGSPGPTGGPAYLPDAGPLGLNGLPLEHRMYHP
jgi:hypothetical protein